MKPFIEISHLAKKHPILGPPEPTSGGYFELYSIKTGRNLRIIASWVNGWDHVSVSLNNRCPNWDEMSLVKRAFFKPNEVAYQLHPSEDEYINIMPYCLHIWRHHTHEIPLPPREMIG